MERYSLNPSFFSLKLDDYSLSSNPRKEFLDKIDRLPSISYTGGNLSPAQESLVCTQIATSLKIAFEIDPSLENAFKNEEQLKIIVTSNIRKTFTEITGIDSTILRQNVCAITLSRRAEPKKDTVLIDRRLTNPKLPPDSPAVIAIASVAHECYHLNLPFGLFDERQEELFTTEKTISFLEKLADKHPELREACIKSIEQEKEYREKFL